MNSIAVGPARHSGYIVRRAQLSDIEAIRELATAVRMMPRWAGADYHAYCVSTEPGDTQVKSLFVACIQTPDEGASFAFGRKEVVGFAAFSAISRIGGGECTLENMAVAEPWRRQGIALRLLAAGLLWCRAWCPGAGAETSLWLEVRASNRGAIALYENAGFVVTGSRPRYYTQPEEDAILMSRLLDARLRAC